MFDLKMETYFGLFSKGDGPADHVDLLNNGGACLVYNVFTQNTGFLYTCSFVYKDFRP